MHIEIISTKDRKEKRFRWGKFGKSWKGGGNENEPAWYAMFIGYQQMLIIIGHREV